MAFSLFLQALTTLLFYSQIASAAPQGVGLVRRAFNDLGCWGQALQTDSTFSFSAGSAMSETLCQETCAANGFAGEFMDASNVCHCWNSFTGGTQVASTQCNNPCPGNTAQNCGGTGVVSVFGPSAPAAAAPVVTSTTTTTEIDTTTTTDTITTTTTSTDETTATTTSTDVETTTTTSITLTTSTSIVPSQLVTTTTATATVTVTASPYASYPSQYLKKCIKPRGSNGASHGAAAKTDHCLYY